MAEHRRLAIVQYWRDAVRTLWQKHVDPFCLPTRNTGIDISHRQEGLDMLHQIWLARPQVRAQLEWTLYPDSQ
jgi:hypothetical protein